MGLVPMPKISSYWSKDDIYHNKFVSSLMPRDRFLSLLRYLHFADNETAGEDRLHKLKPLLNKLLSNFQSVLLPGREIIIDESMIPWRGRLIFKQYIPNKTHKYGVKLYKLCTLDGYTLNIIVYSGKDENSGKKGFAHAERIVMKLIETLQHSDGRILYADNYYSSIPLVKKLHKKKITYCGTLRANRKGIPRTFTRKMKKAEIYGEESSAKVRIIKWVDKRPVLMITSDPRHEAILDNTRKKNRKGEIIRKPRCVLDYNKAKKGVDMSDQMSSYFTVLRKSLKWYRKVCFELLFGTCVVNAWVVYNATTGSKVSMLEFRERLVRALGNTLTSEFEEKTPKRKTHTFIKPEGKGRKPRKRCVGCYQKLRETMDSRTADKKTRKVISYCNDCDGQPGYCLQCFNNIHKV